MLTYCPGVRLRCLAFCIFILSLIFDRPYASAQAARLPSASVRSHALLDEELESVFFTQPYHERVRLLHISSDAYPVESDVFLLLGSDHQVLGFHYVSTDGTDCEFSIDELPTGVMLMSKFGIDVVRLKIKFEKEDGSGYQLELSYLKNAFWRSYASLTFQLVRDLEWPRWQLVSDDGGAFDSLFFKGSFLFSRAVGIESGQMSWTGQVVSLQ